MFSGSRMQSRSLIRPPSTRVPHKAFVNVEINTDPWIPECPKCLQRERNSQFSIENNSASTEQYVKAINYINSIHTLINESLQKQSQELKNGAPSYSSSNFSMPALPNFLTILSSLNLSSSTSSEKPSQMISRTTSTSSLKDVNVSKSLSRVENQNKDKYSHQEIVKRSSQIRENTFMDVSSLAEENTFGQKENSRNLKHFIRNMQDDSSTDTGSDSSKNENITEYHVTKHPKMVEQNQSKLSKRFFISKHLSDNKSCKIINLTNSKHKLIYEGARADQEKEHPEVVKLNIGDQRTKGSISHWSSRKKTKDRKKRKCDKVTLSEAELNHYASELLYDTSNTESSNIEASIMVTTRTTTIQPEKEFTAQLLKDENKRHFEIMAPINRLKTDLTRNNIKQVAKKCGKQSRSFSMPKSRSSSRGSSSTDYFSNTPTVVMPCFLKKGNSIPVGTNSEYKNKEGKSTAKQHAPKNRSKTAKTPVINLPKQVEAESKIENKNDNKTNVNKRSNLFDLPNQKLILPKTHKHTPRQKIILNKSPTWVVQQKDFDDFVCQVKPMSTKSTETVRLTDRNKTELGISTECNVNDIVEMQDMERPKTHPVHSAIEKSRRTRLHSHTNSSHEKIARQAVENLRDVPIVETPIKSARKQPFRETRDEPSDTEEIMNMTDCISRHSKTLILDSDLTSNVSQSSISSDIKSDKDGSPVRI